MGTLSLAGPNNGTAAATVCKITITPDEAGRRPAQLAFQDCEAPGDGTVPQWIAAEDGRIRIELTQSARSYHASILSSDEFLNFLARYFNELHHEFVTVTYKKTGSTDVAVNVYKAEEVKFIPPSDPVKDVAPADAKVLTEVRQKVQSELNVPTERIYEKPR